MKYIGKICFLIIFLVLAALSSCKTIQTQPPPAEVPATPINLQAIAKNSAVELNWAANTEADLKGYNVYWGTQSGQLTSSKFVDKTKTTATIGSLSNGKKYFFAIDAENTGGKKSNKTAEVTATPVDNSAGPGDPESYAPGKTGEVKSFTLHGKTYYYEVIDGLAIYEGDMILGEADQIDKVLAENSAIDTQGITCDGSDWVFFYTKCNKWPNGVVRYQFKNDWGNSSKNRTMRGRVRAAIRHWEQKTNLHFVEASSGDRLLFKNSDGCSSKVGRIGSVFTDTQDVNLSMDCSVGNAIHEIGHAIGIFHEQSREDRDSHVRINRSNIKIGKRHNFNKENSDALDVGPYDFGSIMHYGCYAFSRNGRQTIVPLDSGISCDDIGQRTGLSEGDILSEYYLYRPNFHISRIAENVNITRGRAVVAGLDFDIEAVDGRYVSWSSNRVSGSFHTGLSAAIGNPLPGNHNWPLGRHRITATVAIRGVVLSQSSVNVNIQNSLPTVNITDPAHSGQRFCKNESITFKASSIDLDTLPAQTLPDSAFKWYIGSSSHSFASGATVNKSFSATGTYTVKVVGTDADGGKGEDSVRVQIVNCSNHRPVVEILNPPDAPGSGPDVDVWPSTHDAHGYYYEITLRGRATDVEDGTLSGNSLVWTTDRGDVQPGAPSSGIQVLGHGNVITVKLYAKGGEAATDHIITLTVTDSDGNHSLQTRKIRINQLI